MATTGVMGLEKEVTEIVDVKEALNEYFRLKEKFENDMMNYKKKIMNNNSLSKREKHASYLKLMPKCVNCKKPSKKGTLFSITFHPSNDKTDAYRQFSVLCGNLANPCNLHIEINLGQKDTIDQLMADIRREIIDSKNDVINYKNKLLFGLISTETAIDNFDLNKSYINELTSIYERYLDKWNTIVENPHQKVELNESLTQSYAVIETIKKCIKELNETNNHKFAVDAVQQYNTILHPLLSKIRHLKYKENMVYSDDNFFKLIQRKYTYEDILLSAYDDKVVAYDVGLKQPKVSKKFIIEDDDEQAEEQGQKQEGRQEQEHGRQEQEHGRQEQEGQEKEQEQGQFTINIKPSNEILEDEPIIGKGKDGILWNNPVYQSLWDKLPDKIKTEFKLNIDWLKEFMNMCVNSRNQPNYNGCKLTIPPNIVIPPREMANGDYDFGVSIYNSSFNKLIPSTKTTYLTLYKIDPITKAKNYKMLENALNELVEKEVGWNSRGFF